MTPQPQYAESEILSFELELAQTPAPVSRGPGDDRSQTLSQAARLFSTAVNPDELLRALFEDMRPVFGIDAYFNYMINERGDGLALASYEGIAYEDAGKMERLEFGRGVCGNVALKRAPIAVSNVQSSNDPRVQAVKGFGIRAYACQPLLAGEHLIGTLSFASRTRESFSDEDLEQFGELAHEVALAYVRLRRVHHRREADRQRHEFLVNLMQELQDPGAPMRAALEVIRTKAAGDTEIETACITVERQLQSKMRLLQDLLDVAPVSEAVASVTQSQTTAPEDVTFTYTPTG
jgi:GAF domain-containing protein